MTGKGAGRHGQRHAIRRVATSVALALGIFITTISPPGSLPLLGRQADAAPSANHASAQHPNIFDPRTRTNSVTRARPRPAASARPGPVTPRPFKRDLSTGFAPLRLRLDPVHGGRSVSADGAVEVDVPPGAVTRAEVSAAGGSMTVLVRQVLPASGGSAGGSGRYSFGTFAVQVLDAHGHLARGLHRPLTVRLHYAKRATAFDLARTQVILNGSVPPWVNLDPAAKPGAMHSSPVRLGPAAHQRAALDTKSSTLSASVPMADPTAVVSWDTDAAVATFGKPDPSTVDLNGGNLNTSYPIDVPAGPGGLKPPLALSYSSAAVAEAHGVQSAAPWAGEGWNLALGSISWAQFNVQDLPSNNRAPQWEQRWQLSDPFGTAAELIPPNVFASTFFNDSPNPITPSPVQWHTAPESHAKVVSYTGPNTLPGQSATPPCFRVFLVNGIMEEFGCTPDSLQFYPGSNGNAFIANWHLDLITDPKGNQIHITYQSDTATGPSGMSYPRDTQLATVEYDSPGCVDAQHACTGASWTPLLRVNFAASHAVAHVNGSSCPANGNLRCDDPADLSGSGGVAAPLVQSTFVLNDVQVQVRPDPNSAWNTLRDYQLGYDQSGTSTFTDPVSGTQESAAGKLTLTKLTEIGNDGSTSLPPRAFGYTQQTEYYEDTQASPKPATNCGPAFNTGTGAGTTGCPIWNQSRDGNSFYLTSVSNGLGLAQSFTYQLARNNTHDPTTGSPGGGADPFFCTNASADVQASYPCNVADDEAWSRVVLTQKTNSLLRLFKNPLGAGTSQRTVNSTTSYAYQVPALTAQPCPDCGFGLYWGNQNDFDFLDFYNYKFMGFAQATVSNPDGTKEVHSYHSTEGIGIYSSDTTQITCDTAVRFPCHRDPWWDLQNAAHGREKQLDTFDVDGTTLLSRTTTTYTATCPPAGVVGSPNNVGWGSWDGMLVSEVDHSNPMAACDIQAIQVDKYTIDGSASTPVPHSTVTSTFDSFGRLTSETTTSNNGGGNGSPTTIVKKHAYVWNDGVTATATSATGSYLIDFPAFDDIEDTFSNRYQCTYTSYDGQGKRQGQTPNLTAGEVTRTDKYTGCGSAANNFTPSGQISETKSYDVHGNQVTSTDADANAGNSAHRGCTVNGAQFTACTTYDTTFAFLPTAQANALNQATSTGYQPPASETASGGFGLWPVSTTDLNGQTTSTAYDPLGRPTSQTLPGEAPGLTTTATSYTTWCSGTNSQGACVEIDHSQRINGTTTVTSRAFFDGLANLIETRVPAPGGRDVVRYSFYDESQRLAFQSNAYFAAAYTGAPGPAAFSPPDTTVAGTTHIYPSNLSTTTVDSLSNQTVTSKSVVCGADGTGDAACYEQSLNIDPLGHQQSTLTDAIGRKDYQQLFTGNSPASYAVYATGKYTYDFQGNPTQILQPNGTAKTRFRYDMAGRKTGMTDPDRGVENYALDQNGNQIQATDARAGAGTVFIGYDALNRPLWKNATASTPAGAFATYSYDSTADGNFGVGKLTSETFNSAPSSMLSGSYAYLFDDRGRQLGSTLTVGSASYTPRTSYDDAGNALTQHYPDGETVTSTYSPEAWLTAVQTQQGSTTTSLVSGIGYTGPGGATGEMTSASLGGGTFAYSASFDDMLRNTDVSIANSYNQVLFDEARSFDGSGNVTTENTTLRPGGLDTQVFCYDEQNRLTWAGSEGTPPCTGTAIQPGSNADARYSQSFTYDNMGRLTQGPQGSYTYSNPAHLHGATSIGSSWTASYDAAGNMTCRAASSDTTCTGSSSEGAQLTYDSSGQLVGWQDKPTHPSSTASFLYDGQGQRVAQQTQDGSNTLTVYVGNIEEVTTDGHTTTTSAFYYANSMRLAMAINGHVSYLANDALGSATAALRNGSVEASQLYAPYGTLRFQDGTMPTTFGFTGQRTDAVSGLDYYGARYYDPLAGQFASADNMLEGNGFDLLALSRYAYVTGNPEVRTDATGHCPWCIAAVVGAVVGAGISYGTQVVGNLQHGQSLGSALTHVNGGEIAKAALVGAVIGATGGIGAGAATAIGGAAGGGVAGTIVGTAAVGAVTNAGAQVGDNLLHGRQWDDNLALATVEGAALGPAAHYGGRYASRFIGQLFTGTTENVVAADAGAGGARFIVNSSGDVLDTSRITIPEGKFGYLLKNPSKAGVFSDSMGYDQQSLDVALRSQLVDNFGDASPLVPMTGGGMKFSVTSPLTGPSGATWNITSAWGIDPNGLIRLITATP